MDDLEQQVLARMSTALQALSDDDIKKTYVTVSACLDSANFNQLVTKAIADERYRRELAEAEAAKELTP